MRVSKFYLPALAALLSVGAISCSKKQQAFLSDYFSTNPTPLQTVGQNVPGEITGRIPAKVMQKNAKVTTTPVLVWTGGEAKGQPVVFQGVNVKDNGQTVPETGGSVMVPFFVAYQPGMQSSDLYLDFVVDQNGKVYDLPRVKVGYGVISTSTLASPATVAPATASDGFQQVISEKYSADIHFLINQANVRANQTDQASYIDLNKALVEANAAPNKEIAGITINSYASPEGTLAFNTQLAEKREKNTTVLVEEQLKKDKITQFGELTGSFTPEDWEGFQKLVEKSNIQDKELILAVLSMYKDPEEREREIRNLSSVFNELAEQILPQLRYSRIQATINVIGKTDEQLIDLYNTDPSKLSVDEILYIATLTDDNTRKMAIYDKAKDLYPNDARVYNNLGTTQYKAGDYANATKNFNKAAQLNPQSKEAAMNKGLIYMLDGNWTQANESLGSAAGLPENQEALGVYYLQQGELQKAKTAFGDSKSNNAALAQILAGDYSAARNTLSAIAHPDATTYYLTAILGARTDNSTMVISNLREAIKLDPEYLTRARKDLEFKNYNLSSL